jgi:hypothetical protein
MLRFCCPDFGITLFIAIILPTPGFGYNFVNSQDYKFYPNLMLTYSTERPNYWPYILKLWSVSLAIFLLAVVYDYFFPSNYAKGIYWVAGLGSLARLIDLMSKPRIQKIVIDEESQLISQYYKSPMSGQGEKSIGLKHIRVYIKKSKSSGELRSIDFYKGYRRIMNLDRKKDGFSLATLQELYKTLKRLEVRITE